jgi:hypothetical protein
MDNTVTGIHEDNLNALSIEVLDRTDRISEIFQKIDSCMERLTSAYQGSPCDQLTVRYEGIKSKYPLVKENIRGYATDFTTLVAKVKENDKYLAQLFRNASENLKSTTKKEIINNEGEE